GRYGRGVIARGRFLLAGLVISACLIGAFARLYTLAMVVALGLTFAVSKPGWKRGGTILIGAACTAGVLLSLDHLGARLLALNADLTLTGRTTMWARTLAVLGDAEWVGRGYAAFDHPSYDWMWAAYRPAHPHNSFIQAYFETGYVGLGLTIALVISHLRIALRVSRVTGRYSYSLFLVLLAGIGSLTGSNYAGKPTLLFSLMLLVLGIESRQVLVAARVRGNRIVPIAATKNARAAIR